jgi:Family of unknown function (DUF6230)
MSVENSSKRQAGRVKWRRFAYVAVPAGAIAAILVGLTAQGAIASSISVSGEEYLVTATQLNGTGFVQFGTELNSDQNGSSVPEPAVESGISSATLANLCQAVKVGPVTMKLTAGSGSTPVSASNLIVDTTSQQGSLAVFHNIAIGQDASTLDKDGGLAGTAGGFGQQADSVTIDNLVQQTWLTTAGTFTLPGLNISFGGSC